MSQPLEIIQHTCGFDRPFAIGVVMPGTGKKIGEAVGVREEPAEPGERRISVRREKRDAAPTATP